MAQKYVCIHGHFYQPPRENPWLEEVERQESAAPFHDWNERISKECYNANNQAKILNGDGYIVDLINNYSQISFNFGPTLLSWMRRCNPKTYEAILEADRQSVERFSGHGCAIAQVFNHIIMPLASRRDKETSIYWGIKDFEYRFKRYPEGMWLAETAVDNETLELLAEHEIKYTILAPHQAKAFRKLSSAGKEQTWQDVNGGRIDPTRPYWVNFPNGKKIAIFFYDGPISRAVAFENLLDSGEKFADRLMQGYKDEDTDQLVHIATDGETYGHHHHHGEMALAYALHYFEKENLAKITNYGEYLETHPPQHEAQIYENTAWSCAHGVERWRSDCGCSSGMHQGWHQKWRAPLREAFDWLRDHVDQKYEEVGGQCFHDPWKARNQFIDVLWDRNKTGMQQFLQEHSKIELNDSNNIKMFILMEMQRNRILIYTSCAWFFDEISGIETVQCLKYAARVIQLYQELFSDDLEEGFLEILKNAPSNLDFMKNGKNIYISYAKKSRVSLEQVAAHYVQSSVFHPYKNKTQIFAFDVDINHVTVAKAGKSSLLSGHGTMTSQVTWESETLYFCALHLGDHNITAGIMPFTSEEQHEKIESPLVQAFERGDMVSSVQLIREIFNKNTFTLAHLFRDQQYEFVNNILHSTMEDVEAIFTQLFNSNIQILSFLNDIQLEVPPVLGQIVEHVKGQELLDIVRSEKPDLNQLKQVVKQINKWQVNIKAETTCRVIEKVFSQWVGSYSKDIYDLEKLKFLNTFLNIIHHLPISFDFHDAQIRFFKLVKKLVDSDDQNFLEQNHIWNKDFEKLCKSMKVDMAHFKSAA